MDPQTTASGSGDPGSDPARPSDGKGDPAESSGGDPTKPSVGTGDPEIGDPGSDSDCQALWAVIDDIGCDVAKVVCAFLEAIPVGGAEVSCDVAVPLACGLASAAADAAEALCPK